MERSEKVEGKEILACEAYLDEDLAKKRSFLFKKRGTFLNDGDACPKGSPIVSISCCVDELEIETFSSS